jgi:hypothetical protein
MVVAAEKLQDNSRLRPSSRFTNPQKELLFAILCYTLVALPFRRIKALFTTVGLNEGLLAGNRFRIAFDAKPGETYEINAKVASEKLLSGTWRTWVTEVSTGTQFEGEVVNR